MFFDFLLDHTLHSIETVVVKTKAGTWALHDTVIFVIDGGTRIQVLIDINSQQFRLIDRNSVLIRGDYDDLISYDLVCQEPVKRQPSMVRSVTEFTTANGKVIACEVELDDAGLAIVLDPEDCELRQAGAAWEYCRIYGVPQLGSVTVTLQKSTCPP